MLFVRGRLIVALATLVVVIFAACGEDADGDDGPPSGLVRVDGSSTVYPITLAMAREFAGAEPLVDVEVSTSSTSRGFELLCDGNIEIMHGSRTIERQEIESCTANGVADLVEVQVGVDALTVVVHPENEFVDCLTTQQLFDIFTGAATTWKQVDPAFPDTAISMYYPDAGSGSFEYFVDRVVAYIDEDARHVREGTASEDDTTIAEGVASDPNAIGYFGFTRYVGADEPLKAVAVDAGDGCVAPSIEAAYDRTYYLSRPLFIYTRESFLAEGDSPVLAFVNFYMENTVGFVPSFKHVPASG